MRTAGDGPADQTTDAAPEDRDPVEALAGEFIAARRRGETPGLDDYAARCPDRADEIRELFPAIAAMERWKPVPTPSRSRPPRGTSRERLGDYRLIREIGRGGMGVVYEAEQEGLARRVAVKVLTGAAWADDLPIRRFLREARTAAGLGHGNSDLGRFVEGRPILARKASTAKRLARWVGRNRSMAALAGTSMVLAVVAAVFVDLFLAAPPRPPGAPGGPPGEFEPGPPPGPGDFPPDRPPHPGWFGPGRRPFPPPPPPPRW